MKEVAAPYCTPALFAANAHTEYTVFGTRLPGGILRGRETEGPTCDRHRRGRCVNAGFQGSGAAGADAECQDDDGAGKLHPREALRDAVLLGHQLGHDLQRPADGATRLRPVEFLQAGNSGGARQWSGHAADHLHNCPWELVEDYCNKLEAPKKGFYKITNSAHSPLWENYSETIEALLKIKEETINEG